MKEKRPLRRHSYILVLWAEESVIPGGFPVWHASLEDAQTTQRYGFRNLAELNRFLEEKIGERDT